MNTPQDQYPLGATEQPKTLGIPPASRGALQTLQFNPTACSGSELLSACATIATYQKPEGDQVARHANLSASLAAFLHAIVTNAPPGPERSTAISRAREAKMWASAAIALEGK